MSLFCHRQSTRTESSTLCKRMESFAIVLYFIKSSFHECLGQVNNKAKPQGYKQLIYIRIFLTPLTPKKWNAKKICRKKSLLSDDVVKRFTIYGPLLEGNLMFLN